MKRSTIALEDEEDFNEIEYEPPLYKADKDYFAKYWTSFIENERVLTEIQDTATENLRSLNQIYNLEDFYENNLLPKMFAFPHQYVARIVANKNKQKGIATKENADSKFISDAKASEEEKAASPVKKIMKKDKTPAKSSKANQRGTPAETSTINSTPQKPNYQSNSQNSSSLQAAAASKVKESASKSHARGGQKSSM